MDMIDKLELIFAKAGARREALIKEIDTLIAGYRKEGDWEKVESLQTYKATMVDKIFEDDLLNDGEQPSWKQFRDRHSK